MSGNVAQVSEDQYGQYLEGGEGGGKRPTRQRPNHVGPTIDVLKNWLAEVGWGLQGWGGVGSWTRRAPSALCAAPPPCVRVCVRACVCAVTCDVSWACLK